jgi:hypothetical protein
MSHVINRRPSPIVRRDKGYHGPEWIPLTLQRQLASVSGSSIQSNRFATTGSECQRRSDLDRGCKVRPLRYPHSLEHGSTPGPLLSVWDGVWVGLVFQNRTILTFSNSEPGVLLIRHESLMTHV